MHLYTATIAERFHSRDYLFRAECLPETEDLLRCLRIAPDARVVLVRHIAYLDDVPVVSETGPAPVYAPGRASG